MKKRIIIIISALCVILAITFICYSQLLKNERKETYTEPVITTEPETAGKKTTENSITYLAEFKPFECSGEYYCFDRENLMDRYGNAVAQKYDEETDICSISICDTEIFNIKLENNYGVQIYSIIDNSLYLLISEDLYRIELSYDSNEKVTNGELCLVKKYNYMYPIKAYNNKLILTGNSYYSELDTITATHQSADFNKAVDSASVKQNITFDQACNLACNAVDDINNYSQYYEKPYSSKDFRIMRDEVQLIKKPDLYNEHIIHERYPDYAWRITLTNAYDGGWGYTINVFINADSGKVCSMSVNDIGC